jgi:purine catabolism regulator
MSLNPPEPSVPLLPGYPTVAEVLALDAVRLGNPRVVAGAAGLDRRVRWVHVTELTDVREILRGGELVLSTAIAWPDDRESLAKYIADLAGLGAAGLVVELGRRYPQAPPKPLLLAAEKHRLPVITLGRDTRFVAITEAVHARIIDAQLAELRASEEVHQTFTELAVEGAEPAEVVRQIAKMAGHAVVLENLAHQVLVYDTATTTEEALLDGWEGRSRAVRPATRTAYDERSGWLTTVVGARGQDWGRLVLVCDGIPAPAPSRLIMLAERGAATLALNRLMQRDRETLERQTHRTLLTAILNHAHSSSEISLRARAIGVRLDDKRLVGIVLRLRGHASSLEHQSRLRELTDHAAAAVRDKRLAALIGAVDEHSVGLLLALGPQDREDAALESSRRRSASWPDRTAANSPSPWAPPSAPYATRAARCSRPSRSLTRRSGRPAAPRTTASSTCVFEACCTSCGTTRGCRRTWSASSARCSPTTPSAARTSSRCSASTWIRAGTSPPRRTRRTCPAPRSTSACTASSASWAWTSTRSSPASRCTSRCSRWKRCGISS